MNSVNLYSYCNNLKILSNNWNKKSDFDLMCLNKLKCVLFFCIIYVKTSDSTAIGKNPQVSWFLGYFWVSQNHKISKKF